MVQQVPFRLPKPVDSTQVDQMIEKSIEDEYRRERMRRRKSVDDSFRDKVSTNLPTGEFSLSNVSMHDTWQELYFNKFGGQALPVKQNYHCRHCGMEFGMAIPPIECPRCHKPTDFGRLVNTGAFKR